MTEQEPVPPQPASEESLNAEIPNPEGAATDPAAAEEEIDLNPLFPEEETDLNELFPEQEMRSLLKNVQKNKKDLGKMKDRFSESFNEDDSD